MSAPNNSFKLAATCQDKMLAAYHAKISQHRRMLNLIKSGLPQTLAEHVFDCAALPKKCLLYTDTQEWATQLRFHQEMIFNALRESDFSAFGVLEVRLMPDLLAKKLVRKVNSPSKENIALIRENLRSIDDEELKAALSRLSQTLDKLS
jgi:hypothetical protein